MCQPKDCFAHVASRKQPRRTSSPSVRAAAASFHALLGHTSTHDPYVELELIRVTAWKACGTICRIATQVNLFVLLTVSGAADRVPSCDRATLREAICKRQARSAVLGGSAGRRGKE